MFLFFYFFVFFKFLFGTFFMDLIFPLIFAMVSLEVFLLCSILSREMLNDIDCLTKYLL